MSDVKSEIDALTAEVLNNEQPPEAIRTEATRLKLALLLEIQARWRDVNYVDSLVQRYAFDPTWTLGFTNEQFAQPVTIAATTGSSPPRRIARRDRVLQIARELIQDGATYVSSQAIADRLRAEGDKDISLKDLATAVGNTLARLDDWQRLRPGEYAPKNQATVAVEATGEPEVPMDI